ncbi:MAG: sugar transferase [Candidatus Micrarchaeota archaeon]|nr:sugar transferase [Candidatus Micrarchaeota archaeon]
MRKDIFRQPLAEQVCTVRELFSYKPKTNDDAIILNTLKRFFGTAAFSREWHGVKILGSSLLIQQRVGEGGIPIFVYKIVTMKPGLEGKRCDKHNGEHDPRVKSKFHWILRKLHLDEIPQVINLLRGDVKLVGPRPLLPYDLIERHTPEEICLRLSISPGAFPLEYAWPAKNKEQMMNNVIANLPQFIDEMKEKPLLTSLKYIFRISFNLLTGKIKNHA